MKITNFYPVVLTDAVAATAAFYVAHFGFRPVFEADWYVHLQSAEDESVNLAILDDGHDTIPEAGRNRTAGLILNFEVEDVDAHFARLSAAGLPMLLPLRTKSSDSATSSSPIRTAC